MEHEYSSNELKGLSNDQIKKLFFKVRSSLFVEKEKENKKNIEIYLCYISKEIEDRHQI